MLENGTLVAILGLSLLIILHEFGHYLVARACGMRVLRFSVGFGPALIKRRIGETEWQWAAVPLGGFVQIDGMGPSDPEGATEKLDADPRSFGNKPIWQRILVIFAGPAANWLIAALTLFFIAFTLGLSDTSAPIIGEVVADSPASRAGLQAGDRILNIDGQEIHSWTDLVRCVRAHPEQELQVHLRRDQEEMSISLSPERSGEIGRIGAGPYRRIVELSFSQSLAAGFKGAWSMTANYASRLWAVMVGTEEGQLSGLPGIVRMISSQAQKGARRVLEVLAWLSIGLFLLNLAPIPALDGGRLVFLALETIRGRPIDARVEGWVHAVGFVLLLLLLVFVSIRDLL